MITPLDVLSLETWILVGTILILARYYVNKKWQFLAKYNIPHYPPSFRTYGTIKYMFDNPKEFFVKDLEFKEKFGHVYGMYTGTVPHIVISDPEIIKQIMIKEFNSFCDRQKTFIKVGGKAMNNGLTSITGDAWRRVRHTMSPLFSTAKLRGMFSVTEKCADVMVENFQTTLKQNDGKFDTKSMFGKFSLDALCSAAFGVKVNSQTKRDTKMFKMAKKIFDTSFITHPLFGLIHMFPPLEKVVEYFDYSFFPKDSLKYFSDLTETIITNRTQKSAKQECNILEIMAESEISESEAKSKPKGMTRLEITGNALLMLLAGYETTSTAITFLAYNLAWNKDAQQKLRQEIQDIFAKDKTLDYEKVNGMKYMNQCINESLRLYPPNARNARCSETEITVDGVTIPKGITIDIPTYGMMHDPEYWDEPMKFNPERMEDMSKVDPIIFQPFGAGPRNCIGMRFALLEIKIAMCKLLLNFQLDVCSDTPKQPLDLIFQSTIRPKVDTLYLKVAPLQKISGPN